MSNDTRLCCDATRSQYYAIPPELIAGDGNLSVYDLDGAALRVRANALEPFAITGAEARARLHLELGQALGRVNAALSHLREPSAIDVQVGISAGVSLEQVAGEAVQEWLRSLEHAADGPELARQIEQVVDALLAHGMPDVTAAEEQARAERYRRSAENGISRALAAHGISPAGLVSGRD